MQIYTHINKYNLSVHITGNRGISALQSTVIDGEVEERQKG